MNLGQYETLTGIIVSSSRQNKVTAQITRTQRILENLLGYTLNTGDVNDNEYVESGKTAVECPDPYSEGTLLPADAVVNAYRLFPYNFKDKYLFIDPVSSINAVKLVKDSVTYKTLEAYEYRAEKTKGFIKYLEQVRSWLNPDCWLCDNVQLAVDANWLWDTTLPDDLLQVWADMITYYSDSKKNIKSETLGTHSYNKFGDKVPEKEQHNLDVLKKYAGPNGSLHRVLTV